MNPKLMSQLDASMAGDQAHVIEPKMGKRALKKAKKDQREKKEGLGAAWFGMKAPEVTDELKRDLEVLKMRGAIDPKRFYKKTGTQDEGLPKYFQVLHVLLLDLFQSFYQPRWSGFTSSSSPHPHHPNHPSVEDPFWFTSSNLFKTRSKPDQNHLYTSSKPV